MLYLVILLDPTIDPRREKTAENRRKENHGDGHEINELAESLGREKMALPNPPFRTIRLAFQLACGRAERLAHGEPLHHVECPERAVRQLTVDEARVEETVNSKLPSYDDDVIVVTACISSTCYVAQTTVFTCELQTCKHASRTTTTDAEAAYTAKRRPVRIVHAERHNSKQKALKRERQIKH